MTCVDCNKDMGNRAGSLCVTCWDRRSKYPCWTWADQQAAIHGLCKHCLKQLKKGDTVHVSFPDCPQCPEDAKHCVTCYIGTYCFACGKTLNCYLNKGKLPTDEDRQDILIKQLWGAPYDEYERAWALQWLRLRPGVTEVSKPTSIREALELAKKETGR